MAASSHGSFLIWQVRAAELTQLRGALDAANQREASQAAGLRTLARATERLHGIAAHSQAQLAEAEARLAPLQARALEPHTTLTYGRHHAYLWLTPTYLWPTPRLPMADTTLTYG